MIEQFHFLRPGWFFALVPLLLIVGLLLRKRLFSDNWQSVIDEKLLPHLLIKKTQKTSRKPVLAFIFAGLLAILSLAGPAWEKLPQPVFKKQSALLIALDLSRSMDAIDLTPNRLARARYKIADILQRRKEGQTGLIVYAADAYTVTPLSDDTETINALVPTLSTDIMPAEGNNTVRAIYKAVELLNNAGFNKGDILLVTDSIKKNASETIKNITARGFRISVLAVGSADGAPIPLKKGGFLKDEAGQVITPKLAVKKLRSMITGNGGIFSHLSIDDSDIEQLMPLIEIRTHQGETIETEIRTDIWREFGPWLLVILLPLAALAFRRGYLVLAAIFLLPIPQPAQAFTFSDLWISDNERGMQLYKDQKYDDAAEMFDDKQWKASALYRARQYELSIRQLQAFDSADAHYNRGNALTQQAEIAEAIQAYSKALEIDPKHEDAKYNKELLENLQQEQQDQGEQESRNPEQQEDDETKDSEASDSGNADEMNSEPEKDKPEDKPEEEKSEEEQQQEEEQEEQEEQTEATESPSNNEEQKQSEPGETEDKSDSSPKNSSDEAQQEPQEPSQNPDSEKNQAEDNKKQQEENKQQNQEQAEQQEPEQQDAEQQAAEQGEEENAEAEEEAEQEQEIDTADPQPLSDQTIEQWLNKVEDDPGGLLRRKFKYLYQRQQQ